MEGKRETASPILRPGGDVCSVEYGNYTLPDSPRPGSTVGR